MHRKPSLLLKFLFSSPLVKDNCSLFTKHSIVVRTEFMSAKNQPCISIIPMENPLWPRIILEGCNLGGVEGWSLHYPRWGCFFIKICYILVFQLNSWQVSWQKDLPNVVCLPVLKDSRRHLFWSCMEAAILSAGESGLLLASFSR